MANKTFPNTLLQPTTERHAPPANAANSRTGQKPVREGGGPAPVALKAFLFLLVILCGAKVALAGQADRVERLKAAYALDESVEESDGGLIRRKLLRLLSRPDVRLFLKVIQTAEGGEPDLMVGGCRAGSLKQHPALVLPRRCQFPVRGFGMSTASGNYQITLSNWRELASFLGLRDFSETNQALAALELIRRGGGAALAYTPSGLALKQRIQGGFLKLLRGDVEAALCMSTNDWASSSCSTLPASSKVVYAQLASKIRKGLEGKMQARRGADDARPQTAREKVKAAPASRRYDDNAGPFRRRGATAYGFANRVKE